MFFSYKAKNQTGSLEKGTLESSSKTEALSLLRSKGLIPISIEEKKSLLYNLSLLGALSFLGQDRFLFPLI